MSRSRRQRTFLVLSALFLSLASLSTAFLVTSAEPPANEPFRRTWERTDKPVSETVVSRTWIWGPQANTPGIYEYYATAPGEERLVQYYDKSRMETNTNPAVPADSLWYVTNGLLAKELITGQLQTGDDSFLSFFPAQVNVAGDPLDPDAPTYADLAAVLDEPPVPVGDALIQTIDDNGAVGQDDTYAVYGATAGYLVPETNHTIAQVFWAFMNSTGLVDVDGQLVEAPLFVDPFYGTGFPITEAYWTTVDIFEQPTDVLMQCFERRCLTYNPSNLPEWQVEAGNVGQHYYTWRYHDIPASGGQVPSAPSQPTPPAGPPPAATPTPAPGTTPTPTPTPSDCVACGLDYGRGEIGTPGAVPLGQEEYSDLTLPYLDVPTSHDIDEVVYGRNPNATLYQSKTITLVSDFSPSKQLYYVIDWGDGSAYVSGLMDAHIGINISHTWVGRGTFWVKVWAVDPASDIRTWVKTFDMTVE
jgi:hypothetical protein